MTRLRQCAALAASPALVLGATLTPADGPNRVELITWTERQFGPLNAVGNIVLFALPSAVLRSFGWPLRRTVVAGCAVSIGIELLQLAIPGRTTATADVFFNTLGATAGWLLAREWSRGRSSE